MYSGKCRKNKGGIKTRTNTYETARSTRPERNLPFYQVLEELDCDAIGLVLWEAPSEDTEPAVFTLVESIMICRFGLQMDTDDYLASRIAKLPSYGIFEVTQAFAPSNSALSINSVDEALVDSETYRYNDRQWAYEKRNGNGPRLQAVEDAYQLKQQASNADATHCPVEGCGNLFHVGQHYFNATTLQWICKTCKYSADNNDGIL
ncbi:hypothetical protein D6D17_10411 [Aureobasidium pullulans]|nr:hypothetical protein D6D17_10411 [Aureobasidium pullulans]